MPFGVTTSVPAPITTYDTVHAEMRRRAPDVINGLVLHLARPTRTGFEVVEVWRSKNDYETHQRDLVAPVLAELGPKLGLSEPPLSEEFPVRGLVVPDAGIVQ